MYDFSEKIVVITGGAKGLGYQMAKQFLAGSAQTVVILDINEEVLQAAKQSLDESGQRVFAAICDVGNHASVEQVFNQIKEKFGRIDILVNNAGITADGFATKMSAEQFNRVVQISLNGSFYCTQQVIGGMREQQWGRIINLSSMAAEGNIGQTNYAAAKAGIIGMTRTLSDELAGSNITVNAIQPGLTNTDIVKTIPEDLLKRLIQNIPAKRMGQPEEVANLVTFLASDQAAYISGENIKISGGLR